MSNWSELLHDLLVEIVGWLKEPRDFITFGAVCKGWSKAGKKEHFKGLWLRQGTPYMMLPTRNENDDVREFYSLVEGDIMYSVRNSKFKMSKCYESLGWLLVADKDGRMCLLDPFSSAEISLPHQNTFPEYKRLRLDGHVFVHKMVLSSRPSESSDFILMIICGGHGHLAFWRPGDESWNRIEIRNGTYMDVMYHDGHFYAIGRPAGTAWVFTLDGHHPPKRELVTRLVVDETIIHLPNELVDDMNLYILKTPQSLFMISRDAIRFSDEDDRFYYNTSKFHVYEVDMSKGKRTEINNLGSIAIFVGHSATFAVDSSSFFGKIKGNHIYFTDDGWESYHFYEEKGCGKDMGAYNMETETIESFYPGEVLLSKVGPSIWITPFFN